MGKQSDAERKVAAIDAALKNANLAGVGAERPEEWKLVVDYMLAALKSALIAGAARAEGRELAAEFIGAIHAQRKAKAFDGLVTTLTTLAPRVAWVDKPEEAWDAAAKLLGAFSDALEAGGAGIEAQKPVFELLGALGAAQQGDRTWLKKLAANARPPREDVGRSGDLGLACAVMTLMKPEKSLVEASQEVARAVRWVLPAAARSTADAPARYLRDYRKELTKGRKPEAAQAMYEKTLKAVKRALAQEVAAMKSIGTEVPPNFARQHNQTSAASYLELLIKKGHRHPATNR